jgi:hypothetical protein
MQRSATSRAQRASSPLRSLRHFSCAARFRQLGFFGFATFFKERGFVYCKINIFNLQGSRVDLGFVDPCKFNLIFG